MTKLFLAPLFVIGILLSSTAFADEPMSLEQLREEIMSLQAEGYASLTIAEVKNGPASLLVNEVLLGINILRDLHRILWDSQFNDIPKPIPARVFKVLVAYHRHLIRSKDGRAIALSLSNIFKVSLNDVSLYQDIARGIVSGDIATDQRGGGAMITQVLMTAVSGNQYRLDSSGTVTISEEINLEITKAIVDLILAPFREQATAESFQASANLARAALHLRVSAVEWNDVSSYIEGNWSKISVEQKKILIQVIEHLEVVDAASAEILMTLEKKMKRLPLTLKLIGMLRDHFGQNPAVAQWIRRQLRSSNPEVRLSAAFALGHYGVAQDGQALQEAFDQERNTVVKGVLAYTLKEYWMRQSSQRQIDTAYSRMVGVYHASKGSLHDRIGRTLDDWKNVTPTLKLKRNNTAKIRCGETVVTRTMPAIDIWKGE